MQILEALKDIEQFFRIVGNSRRAVETGGLIFYALKNLC